MKYYTVLNKLQIEIREKLIKRASEGGFYTYTELDEDLGCPYDGLKNSSLTRRIGADLGVVSKYEMENKRPLLSAIVVRKGKKEPGSGFYKMAYEIGKLKSVANREKFAKNEQIKVHEYWKKHIDEDHDDMTKEGGFNEKDIDTPSHINAENKIETVVENRSKFFFRGYSYENILNDPKNYERGVVFLINDKDGETIISLTAKDINEGRIIPFKTNWMLVTLYLIPFIRELLELIDSVFIDEVSQAIEDELNRHKCEDGRYTKVKSYYYGTGKIASCEHTYLLDWNDYDISIVKAISKEIIDNRKKTEAYQKKLEMLKEGKETQKHISPKDISSNSFIDTESLLQEIEDLKAKVDKLTSENAELEKRNNELEKLNASLENLQEQKEPEIAYNEKTGKKCFTSTQMGILMQAVGLKTEDPAPGKTTLGEVVEKISGYNAPSFTQNMKGAHREADKEVVANAIESKFPNLAAKIRNL